MTTGVQTIIYPVDDLARAKTLYGTLIGTAPLVDTEHYVGFRVADQDVGLDPSGPGRGMTGPVSYWHVDDIKKSMDALLKIGACEHQAITDVGGSKFVGSVKDADGNVIGLIQARPRHLSG